MQIFEITAKNLKEYALKGVPTTGAAPATWDYSGAMKTAGLSPAATPAATPAVPTPTLNPLPLTPGYSATTSNAPGWDYAGASKSIPQASAASAAPTAPTAPATPIGQQPKMSAKDWAGVQGDKLARGAIRGANMLGSIGNALGSQILQKAGLPGELGMSKSNNPFGDKEAQARQAVARTNQTLADQLYKKWTAASARTAPNTPAMQQSLNSIITNTLLRGRQPTDFTRYVSQDKAQEVTAQLQKINQARSALASKNAQMTYQDWEDLVNATSELNHLLAFWPLKWGGVEMRKDGKFYSNGAPLDLTNPQDLAIYQNAAATQSIRYPSNVTMADVNKKAQATTAQAQAQGQTK